MTPQEIKQRAENDLNFFAHLVNHNRVYGEIHTNVFKWWQECLENDLDNTMLLMPRDHQKSFQAAVKAAWFVTKDPTTTILYVSATAELALKQLRAIKNILLSDVYQRYWPEMIDPEEGRREKWTEQEICVDHPLRKAEGIRDSTILACGITKTITGLHVNHVFLDDLVVPGNAYTEEGRRKVRDLYSQLASIETTGSTETVVGTRYHPSDIYNDLMEMREPVFDPKGEIIGEQDVYTYRVHVVEENGHFLWPREARPDGKQFGFNMKELARKKAKYLDKVQFYAQYYQEPNDPESHRLGNDRFQYYDRKHIKEEGSTFFFKNKPLNVYASIDFAYSLSKKADYTAIVVVGVDPDGFIYILDIDRFKTDKINDYFQHVVDLHEKWQFKKLRAEVTAAQKTISNELKDRIRQEGMRLSIDENRPSRHEGAKEERIAAVLEPRYENMTIYHFRGGYIPVLEEELILARPAHDDVKDALASVVEIAKAPKAARTRKKENKIIYSNRFGGIA